MYQPRHIETSGTFYQTWRPALWMLAVCVAALVVFRLFPQIDHAATSLFFLDKDCLAGVPHWACGYFPIVESVKWGAIRELGLRIPPLLFAATVIYLIYLAVFRANTAAADLRNPAMAAASFLAGPILLVNVLLKELWGRPRPYQVDAFGGDSPYVLPGTISDHCTSNCSFVSGEAASAFWMLSLLVFVPKGRRVAVGILAGFFAAFFSFLRVAFGRHFVSDVTMSALFTVAIIFFFICFFRSPRGRDLLRRIAEGSNRLTRRLSDGRKPNSNAAE